MTLAKDWTWEYEESRTRYYHIYAFDSDYIITFDGPRTPEGDEIARSIVQALNAERPPLSGSIQTEQSEGHWLTP